MFYVKKFRSIFLLVFFFCVNTYAQDTVQVPERFVISTISVSGNEKTLTEIILKELTFSIGDSITNEQLKFNRERIFSLGLFSEVDISVKKINGKNELNIVVSESWYIWLVPTLDINDRDFKKLSYGFYLAIDNLRGRNESLRLGGALGYNPKFYWRYTMPYLFTKEDILGEISGYYGKVKNLSKVYSRLNNGDFENKTVRGAFTLSKRFEKFHYLQLSAGYTQTEIPADKIYKTLSGTRIDRVIAYTLAIVRDSRDLKQFPSNGSYFNAYYKFTHLTSGNGNYSSTGIEFKKYISVGDWSLKFRIFGKSHIGSSIPVYDLYFLGYDERNRGNYNRVEEGEMIMGNQIELRYPIVKEYTYEIPFEFIPETIRKYRTAIYFQIFSDQHLVKSKFTNWKQTNVLSGYGAGFTFLVLPYNALRIEYGFNEIGLTNLVIDVGISF